MATKSVTTKHNLKIEEFLRLGGTKIPAGFASKAAAATKSMLRKQLDGQNSLLERGAKLYSGLKGAAAVAVNDPANKKALDELLSLHKKIAGKKLAFPKVPVGVGGFLPGTISGTIVPPFDFADSIPVLLGEVADATISASANVNGQISASAASSAAPGFNGGSEYARVGIYFHPTTSGTLTISASPTYSYEWLTNSLNTNYVGSSGEVGLTIYGLTDLFSIGGTAGASYESWQEFDTGEIDIDFGFNVTKSLSVSLEVTPAQFYICFVEVDALAVGVGWPGSLASAMATATVPSISYEFTPRLVVEL
ncbi:MAG: hypothetical protein WA817_18980 [Candidatus Acidiferrum sp.]